MKQKLAFIASILTLAIFGASDANAQWVQTSGPSYTNCLTVNGTNLFAGFDSVYRSTDNGNSWMGAGLPDPTITALLVDGTKLLAGTYTQSPGQLSEVFISADSGKNWATANNGFPTYNEVTAFGLSGPDIFAGTFGTGIFISTDNGSSWTAMNNGFPTTPLQPGSPAPEVYAFAVIGTNTASPILFAGTADSGVYRSTNNGTSWTVINNGLPNYLTEYVKSLAVIGKNGSSPMLFAGIHATAGNPGGGVHLSTNSGASWMDASNGLTSPYVDDLAVIGSNLFAGTYDAGVFLSTDSGASWTAVNTGLTNLTIGITALAVIGPYLFAGSYGNGVWRRPLSELINQAQAASDTQFVLLKTGSSDYLSLSGDSGGYSAHRIDFINQSNVAVIVDSAALTTTNNRFSISQLLPGVPDTVQPSDTFSMIVHFTGDTSGTVYLDTIVLKIGDPSSLYVYLTGHSFASPLSGVSQNSQIPSVDFQTYPNPFSQSTTISFSSPESGAAEVSVVNLLGSEVARLFEGELTAGEHSFVWSKPPGLPAGMYECIVRMNGHIERVPMMLAR